MALLFDGCIKSIQVVVFSKVTICTGITSTCRHCTLSNSITCSDSYPIPILSLLFLYPLLLFSSVLRFLLHACMYMSHQVNNSYGGLAPKIGLVYNWAKLDGYSYEQALSRYVFPHCNVC